MNILVLGNAEDAHAAHIKQALTKAGATVDYLDTALFPTQLQMFWRPDTEMGGLILPGKRRLNFPDIKSVFWRQLSGIYIPDLPDSEQKRIAFNDSMSTLRSLMQACPCRWVNSWQAYEFHKEKPLQLRAVKQIGVNIPATLISNDPKEIIEFAKSQEKTIFKPVYGGAHTQLVTESPCVWRCAYSVSYRVSFRSQTIEFGFENCACNSTRIYSWHKYS